MGKRFRPWATLNMFTVSGRPHLTRKWNLFYKNSAIVRPQ